MKITETINIWHCDLCNKESEEGIESLTVPHWFTTEQNEGKPITPYTTQKKMDLCDDCIEKVVVVKGSGAQGYNKYNIMHKVEEMHKLFDSQPVTGTLIHVVEWQRNYSDYGDSYMTLNESHAFDVMKSLEMKHPDIKFRVSSVPLDTEIEIWE